jgi:hypothetical protein
MGRVRNILGNCYKQNAPIRVLLQDTFQLKASFMQFQPEGYCLLGYAAVWF